MLLPTSVMEWARPILVATSVAVGIAGIALGLLVNFQEKLIYIPKIPGMGRDLDEPGNYGLGSEEVVYEAAEDEPQLHAWLMYPKGWTAEERKKHLTIIFLQENAGSMAMRLPFFADLIKYINCSVLAASYRGYRLNDNLMSGGSPSEEGIKKDTQAALDHLLSRPDVDPKQISVMGKSLGGATAIHLAAANPGKLCSVVVENTFTSIEDVAHKVLPPLKYVIGRNKPLNFLIRNKWRNFEAIGTSFVHDTPILLLSSLQDEMLPPIQMRELYEIAKNAGAKDVTWVEFDFAHHMDAHIVDPRYWPSLIHFYRTHQKNSVLDSDSEDSTGDFEDVGSEPAVQAMLEAGRAGRGVGVNVEGVRVRHHES